MVDQGEIQPINTLDTLNYSTLETDEEAVYTVDDALERIGMGPFQFKRFPILAMVGFAQSAVLTLPYMLLVAFACEFNLTLIEEALTMCSLFLGNIAGDLIAGLVCDKCGRKLVLILGTWVLLLATASLYFVFFYWLLLWRTFTMGFGIGLCTFTTIIMVSELSTTETRGRSITMVYVFWGGGTLYTAVVAFLFLNSAGWQAVILVVCIPILITAILSFFLTDTPKFYIASGNLDAARATLAKMARENGRTLPEGVLVAPPERKRGEVSDMFEGRFRNTSILLMMGYFSTGFVFYSAYAMLPFLLQDGYCALSKVPVVECTFSSHTLKETALVTAAEVVFLPVSAVLTEKLGRLPTMRGISSILLAASTLLVFCLGVVIFLGTLFIQRGSVQSLLNVLFIYTPEIYPTNMRAVACGVVMSMMTLGGLLSSGVVYIVGIGYSWRLVLGLIAGAAGVSCLVTFLLSSETQGAPLPDAGPATCNPMNCIKSCRKVPEEPSPDVSSSSQ